MAFRAVEGLVLGLAACGPKSVDAPRPQPVTETDVTIARDDAAQTVKVPRPETLPTSPRRTDTAAVPPCTYTAPSGNACKGMNDCKGLGGCKTDVNDCRGKNECKGKGGCKMETRASGAHACAGQNDCKGLGGCKTADNGCKGQNDCKGRGGCRTNARPGCN